MYVLEFRTHIHTYFIHFCYTFYNIHFVKVYFRQLLSELFNTVIFVFLQKYMANCYFKTIIANSLQKPLRRNAVVGSKVKTYYLLLYEYMIKVDGHFQKQQIMRTKMHRLPDSGNRKDNT